MSKDVERLEEQVTEFPSRGTYLNQQRRDVVGEIRKGIGSALTNPFQKGLYPRDTFIVLKVKLESKRIGYTTIGLVYGYQVRASVCKRTKS